MAAIGNSVFNNEELQGILTFLPPKSLKQIRLVCKLWNNCVLSQSKLKLMYCYGSHQSQDFEYLTQECQISDPRIFRHIILNADVKVHKFLAEFGSSSYVQTLYLGIKDIDQLKSLVLAIEGELLPNLRHLSLKIQEENHSTSADCNLEFPSTIQLASLRTLQIKVSHCKFPLNVKRLLQSFINACPNLVHVESQENFDFSSSQALQHLTFEASGDETPSHAQVLRGFDGMLSSLSNSLREISIKIDNWDLFSTDFNSPVRTNLRCLTLNLIDRFESIKVPGLWLEAHVVFPNLRRIRILFSEKCVYGFEPKLLTKGFPNLTVLELLHYIFTIILRSHIILLHSLLYYEIDGDNEAYINYFRQFVKSCEKLKIMKVHFLTGEESYWFDLEDCLNCWMKVPVSNLILQLDRKCTLTTLLRFLAEVEVNDSVRKECENFGILEIRNSARGYLNPKDRDKGERLASIETIARKLLNRFAYIRFKLYQVPTKALHIAKDAIRSKQLPVEIYYDPSS